jgi:hypothetical protein
MLIESTLGCRSRGGPQHGLDKAHTSHFGLSTRMVTGLSHNTWKPAPMSFAAAMQRIVMPGSHHLELHSNHR